MSTSKSIAVAALLAIGSASAFAAANAADQKHNMPAQTPTANATTTHAATGILNPVSAKPMAGAKVKRHANKHHRHHRLAAKHKHMGKHRKHLG